MLVWYSRNGVIIMFFRYLINLNVVYLSCEIGSGIIFIVFVILINIELRWRMELLYVLLWIWMNGFWLLVFEMGWLGFMILWIGYC